MSKLLTATCAAGIVMAGGVPVPAAEKLCEGVGPSSGFLILDEDRAYYVALTTPDVKATLTQLIAALDQAVTAFNSAVSAMTTLDGKPLGTLPPAPAAAASIAQVTAAAVQITAAKVQLTALKEMLR